MSIRGTSAAQDGRYFGQEKKLLAKMTFPLCFEKSVNMEKVQRQVIRQWVTERITQLLGFEDDIVVALAINLLETNVDEKLDPKKLQMALTGFLEKQAGMFTEELWQLLLSAQSNPTGIPSSILDRKKKEMQKIEKEKEQLKKILDTKRVESQSREGDRQCKQKEKETLREEERSSSLGHGKWRRRSRSLHRRAYRRSRSSCRYRSLLSPRKRRRSRSVLHDHSRRGRSRSSSVNRRRGRRSPLESSNRARQRRFARSRSSWTRKSSCHLRRSPFVSSSESRHCSPSSSRSSSPARHRLTKCHRMDSFDTGSDSD